MDTIYSGVHSIRIGDKDTWADWKLVPSSRPFVEIPEVRTNTITIPGANGVIDVSEVPIGMVTYGNRSGSWEFYIAHDQIDIDWDMHLSELLAYIHGKKHQCILSDDHSYYYEGRLTIDSYEAGENYSTISIAYDFFPFKKMIWSTIDDWEWNPFDLIYGEITQSEFRDIVINQGTTKTFTWSSNEVGDMPVTPTFRVQCTDTSASMTLKVENTFNGIGETTFTLPHGVTTNPQIMLACPTPDSKTKIKITGDGLISIDYRVGRL